VFDRAAKILDVHGYLSGKLTGTPVASWTSADPFGVFDIATKAWSAPILDHLGLTPDRFGALARPGAPIGAVTEAAAAETGLAPGTPLFAGGGDGQCAGLGVNAAQRGVIYLNLGTAIITGAWSAEPRIGRFWRTMTSPTGDGYFLEGCQRAGAFFVNWFVDAFAGGRDDPAVFERLEAAAAALPIGAEGATACPYLTGCMDPHWDPNARAAFTGLAPHHGVGHLYRAALEALTLESARCVTAMAENGLGPEKIVAVGGGAASALWRRMLADATGLPLVVSDSLEASALGAGMSAAVGAGWRGNFADAAAAMSREGETTLPDPSARAAWAALSERQAAAYRREG
jgi:xylulokinase